MFSTNSWASSLLLPILKKWVPQAEDPLSELVNALFHVLEEGGQRRQR